jgi:hypothetical protein
MDFYTISILYRQFAYDSKYIDNQIPLQEPNFKV